MSVARYLPRIPDSSPSRRRVSIKVKVTVVVQNGEIRKLWRWSHKKKTKNKIRCWALGTDCQGEFTTGRDEWLGTNTQTLWHSGESHCILFQKELKWARTILQSCLEARKEVCFADSGKRCQGLYYYWLHIIPLRLKNCPHVAGGDSWSSIKLCSLQRFIKLMSESTSIQAQVNLISSINPPFPHLQNENINTNYGVWVRLCMHWRILLHLSVEIFVFT